MAKKYCQGCGAEIQSRDPEIYGFVPENLLSQDAILCQRCFRINHYGRDEIGPVESHNSLQAIEAGLNLASGVVLVVDLMDFESGLPIELLRLIKTKNTLLTITKVDLLPEQTPLFEVQNWVRGRLKSYGLHKVKTFLVSAVNNYGLSALTDGLSSLGSKVLFVGVTNVGKSSVIHCLLQKYNQPKMSIKPTISPYPGTTVNLAQWACPGGLIIMDSPGYVPRGRISDQVSGECAKKLVSHRSLSSHLYTVRAGDLIYIPGLCGLECLQVNVQGVILAFTGSGVHWQKSTSKHLEKWLVAYRGICQVSAWEQRVIDLKPGQDLVINGLGWVSARRATLKLRVHVPQGVQLVIRPNLLGYKK